MIIVTNVVSCCPNSRKIHGVDECVNNYMSDRWTAKLNMNDWILKDSRRLLLIVTSVQWGCSKEKQTCYTVTVGNSCVFVCFYIPIIKQKIKTSLNFLTFLSKIECLLRRYYWVTSQDWNEFRRVLNWHVEGMCPFKSSLTTLSVIENIYLFYFYSVLHGTVLNYLVRQVF